MAESPDVDEVRPLNPHGPGVSSNRRAEHGTPSGYRRHKRNNQDACEECRQAWSVYRAQQRASGKTATPVTPAQCGTRSGYNRHLRHREAPCDACRDAYNRDQSAGHYRRVYGAEPPLGYTSANALGPRRTAAAPRDGEAGTG